MFKKLLIAGLLALNLFSFAAVHAEEDIPSVMEDTSLEGGGFMFDLRSITHEDVKEEKYIRQGLNFIFERVVTIMAATVGTAAVMMIVVGGFLILASAGRQQWLDTGKAFIFKSLLGLVAVLGAYVLVQTVQILIKSIYD